MAQEQDGRWERMGFEFRASQALKLWHDVTLGLVRDEETDLSARQMTVLLTVYLEPPPHTVRGLAEKLGVNQTRYHPSAGPRWVV